MNEKVSVRPVEISDVNFILNSWLKSYRYDSYFAKRIRDNIFFKYHHQVVTRILERLTSRTLIACDPKDPTVIFGYLVYEKFEDKYVVHYCYVKGPFRKLGIGSELIKASELDLNNCYFSHWTMETDVIIKKYPSLSYVPYLI